MRLVWKRSFKLLIRRLWGFRDVGLQGFRIRVYGQHVLHATLQTALYLPCLLLSHSPSPALSFCLTRTLSLFLSLGPSPFELIKVSCRKGSDKAKVLTYKLVGRKRPHAKYVPLWVVLLLVFSVVLLHLAGLKYDPEFSQMAYHVLSCEPFRYNTLNML